MRNEISREGWLVCENHAYGREEFCVFPEVSRRPRDRCVRHGAILVQVWRSDGFSRKAVRAKIQADQAKENPSMR